MENLGNGRVVIVYPDVYQFYLNDSDLRNEVGPNDLEAIVKLSIECNHPTSASVERVLTQVFTEAHRCFYRDSREATTDDPILYAIQRSLRIGETDDVLKRWGEPEFIKLRRGADWMTSVNRMPDALTRPEYIDPVDFLRWVVHSRPLLREGSVNAGNESSMPSSAIPIPSNRHEGDNSSFAERWATIPKMLVGPAHGDLHGRNIIAGVVRGQAEWPAVFDFDKMDNDNIVAWDFAKLELELKCRIFQELIDTHGKRCEVRRLLNIQEKRPIPDRIKLTTDEQRVADRIERMEIMFAIERLLLDGTKRLSSANQAMGHDQDFMASIPVTTALGRALRIIFRIRCEAAMFLGFARQGRETAWIDEYLFSLVVFGVTSLKWHSANEHLLWKLMSAGVAAAGMSTFAWTGKPLEPTDLDSSQSYYPTLFHAYKSWKANRSADSIPKLRAAIDRYPYSVGLRQQLALALLENTDYAEQAAAHQEIESLGNLPIVFRDHEVLCRLGRVFKSRGDAACNYKSPLSEVIQEQLASFGYYSLARDYYRDGFELSGSYYPGVNAATLSLLVGDTQEQKRLAHAVLDICRLAPLNAKDREWLLASAGESSLLIGRADQAADFYRNALQAVAAGDVGSVQSMYDQVCRLHWALAGQVTQETIAVFQADPRFPLLEPGPCTNCDL